MNPLGQVPMLELPRPSSSYSDEPSMDVPRAMEGLQGISPPPFLTKTYDLVGDPNTNHVVSWSEGNNSFVVWDPEAFAVQILPEYFKHGNLSSFIRQLNIYGFKKVDPDKLEFASERFLRGQRHLLKNIKRRKPPLYPPQSSHQDKVDSCVAEVGQFGPESEIDRLRRDNEFLMVELVKVRQEQQNTKSRLKEIEHKLNGQQMKQQRIMGFFARMIQNPSLIQQLVQLDKRKGLEEVLSKKRRRAIDQGLSNEVKTYIKLESEDYGEVTVSGMKILPMDMQVLSGTSNENEKRREGGHKSLDKGFWEELLNDGIEEQTGLFCVESQEENRDMSAEEIGFWGSGP